MFLNATNVLISFSLPPLFLILLPSRASHRGVWTNGPISVLTKCQIKTSDGKFSICSLK